MSFTESQTLQAFRNWYGSYPFQDIDEKLIPFLSDQIQFVKGGWLRNTRQALFLSTGEMAKRLGITRQAYAKFERKDQEGEITIKTLSKIAEAMNCELVYAIRPKQKTRFSQIIWQKVLTKALHHPWILARPENLKTKALATMARWTMDDFKFRRLHKLTERWTDSQSPSKMTRFYTRPL
jgi:transcriptional regulator with XRE-family HTH domain